jgi:hypothetical protein
MAGETGLSRRATDVRVREQAIARPPLPKTTALSPARLQQVDLEERMEPLAVSESIAESDRSFSRAVIQLLLVAVTGVGVWFLLPSGRSARPPIELPGALQGDERPPRERRQAEEKAIGVLEKVGPHDAVDDLRALATAGGASHELWRYYLGTLAQLGEWKELSASAAEYAAAHPDRLEAPHFTAEAIRLTPPADRRDPDAWFGNAASAGFIARCEECLRRLDAALSLLQRRSDDWPAAERRKWADALHLDRAAVHRVLWQCRGDAFDDPERDRALAALDDVSNGDAENVLALRAEIYRRLVEAWPRWLGWERKGVPINGRTHDRGTLRRELAACLEGLEKLPPKGTR